MYQTRIFSDSTAMALDLHVPAGPGPHPVVVLCHGFGGFKRLLFGDFATLLTARGWAAVAFDYRGFGESDGPRGRLFPEEQLADIAAAVTFVTTREELDPRRIAALGISLGGANAVSATARDPRIAVCAALIAVADGETWIRDLHRYPEWLELRRRLDADRVQRTLTGVSEEVDPNSVVLRDEPSLARDSWLRETFAERREFTLSLASAEALLHHKPVAEVHRIAPRGLYLVGCSEDTITPVDQTLALHAAAGDPKELVLLEGLSHWDLYQPEHLERVMDGMIAFFDRQTAL